MHIGCWNIATLIRILWDKMKTLKKNHPNNHNGFILIALQSWWHPSQWNFWSSNNCHMFFCRLQNQFFLQNEQVVENVDNQHHFHSNWPETVPIFWFMTHLNQTGVLLRQRKSNNYNMKYHSQKIFSIRFQNSPWISWSGTVVTRWEGTLLYTTLANHMLHSYLQKNKNYMKYWKICLSVHFWFNR